MRVKVINEFENRGYDQPEVGRTYWVFITPVGFAKVGWEDGPKVFLSKDGKFIKGRAPSNGALIPIPHFREQLRLGNLKIIGE
jgi:hypothetical protein